MSAKTYFGIDLGTTNSVVSFAQLKDDGRIVANPIGIDRVTDSGAGLDGKATFNRARSFTLPSCVYYDSNNVIVGDYAREQYKKYPEKVAKSIKSQMGNLATRGLAQEVIDKTPEEISARILKHLKVHGEKQTRQYINDNVIITVPANFDTARREATMRAAELAGFNVRESDGSWKPILISEPNAVLYDLAQKIQNGEISESVLDLSAKKIVLVFDVGGGTLDVTIHEIERDAENNKALNISEIATSRFTQLAGDDIDAKVADDLFKRCVNKFKEYEPAAVPRIKSREAMVKKMLAVVAEQLKINMNASVENASFGVDDWFGASIASDDTEPTYDISHSIGDERFYNDSITKTEFEEMIAPFLGKEYNFEDYHGYSKNKKIRRDNIIAPILDALEKAARHYAKRGEGLAIDAVVLNGGMSKLYLIKERIKEFFGLEPITTADPDLSVANGAAVYATIKEMCNLQNSITIKRRAQNEDLYLGLSAGANDLLISTDDELPYIKVIDGYRIVPGTQVLEIPIKRGVDDGEPQTIARGIITFSGGFNASTNLKIEANLDQTGLLAIKAILCNSEGVQVGTGNVEIAIGAPIEKNHGGGRIIPANGTALHAANEIDALKNLFSDKNKSKNKKNQVQSRMQTIFNCGNPREFQDVVIKHLENNADYAFRRCLYEIVAALSHTWSEAGVKRVKELSQRDVVSTNLGYQLDIRRVKLSEYVASVISAL